MRGQHPAGMLYRASFLPSIASDTAAQQSQAPAEPAAEAPAEEEPVAEAPERLAKLAALLTSMPSADSVARTNARQEMAERKTPRRNVSCVILRTDQCLARHNKSECA